jgi:hypothetical protein
MHVHLNYAFDVHMLHGGECSKLTDSASFPYKLLKLEKLMLL